MFARWKARRDGWHGSRLSRVTAAVVSVVVVLSAGVVPAQAVPPPSNVAHPRLQVDKVVQRVQAAPGPSRAARTTGAAVPTTPPAWPKAGTFDVDVRSSAARRTIADTLPMSVAPATGAAGTAGAAAAGADAVVSPSKVRVEVLDRAATDAAGVDGVLMRLSDVAGAARPGPVNLAVDYSAFRYAGGGDWSSRLRLVRVPDCALSVSDRAKASSGDGCQVQPLESRNDLTAHVVTATVPVGAGVVALASDPAGAAGDYAATPLEPSANWAAGGSSGDFTWSYPMRVPPSLGGPAPAVGLGYSSSSVDGRMAASNNQPSWVGEGFGLGAGFIERRYASCKDDMGSGANNTTKTGDLCWKRDNAVLSLGGSTTELLKGSDGLWHGRTEDGSQIEQRTGGVNGDNDGEYWVVTATDGTQYWFGRNRLPGWVSGNAVTDSTWTVPVFGNHADEPCHATAFASSACAQAWRWNLDYVIDPDGNSMAYWYTRETNRYAQNGSSTTVADYTRGGHLRQVDYGTRADTAYGAIPMRVVLQPGDRCLTSCGTEASPTKANWPDTPWDLRCTGSPCLVGAPTFWSSKRLASVTTYAGSQAVDSWTLTHSFPNPGDGTRAGLWLAAVQHSGRVGTAVDQPAVTFDGVQMPNRVDATDFAPAMNWWRIAHINTESGGSISVSYQGQDCVRGSRMPAAPETNTLRCYPVRWTPQGATAPVVDYFHKYVVDAVAQTDMALPSDARGTRTIVKYDYPEPPAWHYTDDDGFIQDKDKTWSVWRGYGRVRVTEGDPGEQTRTETVYFRGMHGDKLPTGTRTVSLPAAGGAPAVNDENAYAGLVRESVVYTGPSGAEVSGTVHEPWQSNPTATRTIDESTVEARFVDTAATHSRVALDGGRGVRNSTTRTTFDAMGMQTSVEDGGDDAVTGDEQCSLTTYARNTGAWLMSYVSRVRSFATGCARAAAGTGLTEDDIVDDTWTSYDQQARGAAPTRGGVTRVEELKTWSQTASTYVVTAKSSYDAYGRVVESRDVKDNPTTTAYTPATGGPVTASTVTNPLGFATTTTVQPTWGSPTSIVDANGKQTRLAYDGLGRLTTVWLPGKSTTDTPTMKYEYLLRGNAATVVTTYRLAPNGTYVASHTFYDGLLRQRQTQTATTGGALLVTDTFYDSAGRQNKSNAAHPTTGSLAGKNYSVPPTDAAVPSQSRTVFDGAGRVTAGIQLVYGVEKWRTSTVYGGDRTYVNPPAGGTPTTTVADVRNQTVALRQHTGPAPGAGYDETRYTYDRKGQLTAVTDPAGNSWGYGYDLRGRQIRLADPDRGVTVSGYNDADELVTSTDSRGETVVYGYDALGRKRSVRDDSPTGTLRAEWVYDGRARGQLDRSVRYVNGAAYINAVNAYDEAYQPTQRTITVPAAENGATRSYAYVQGYRLSGAIDTTRLPAAGGLPTETLRNAYNDLGQSTTLTTNLAANNLSTTLIYATSYTAFGELALIGRQTNDTGWVDSVRYYEEGTRRLARGFTTRSTNPSLVTDLSYSYDAAGDVMRIGDTPPQTGTPAPGTVDTQCFGYDYLRRLTEAWTPAGGDCATPASTAGLGGPAPYWQSFGYDKIGNRRSSVDRTPTTSVNRTYAYPAAGAPQPHTLRSVTTNGAAGPAYGYDSTGNTVSLPVPGGQQALVWDAEGELASSTDGTGPTTYVYDADGNRLVRRDPSGQTVYLPGQEIRVPNGGAAQATRYYQHAGQTVATRTSAGVTWLVNDQQGTAQASVNAVTQAVVVRRQTPFGAPRGGQVSWPNDKGFVGGTVDNSGLTHLGAREYDPDTGRFVSADPVIDHADPQQMNGYAYANNTPVTMSDASGLRPACDGYGGAGDFNCPGTGGGGSHPAPNAGSGGSGKGKGGKGASGRRGANGHYHAPHYGPPAPRTWPRPIYVSNRCSIPGTDCGSNRKVIVVPCSDWGWHVPLRQCSPGETQIVPAPTRTCGINPLLAWDPSLPCEPALPQIPRVATPPKAPNTPEKPSSPHGGWPHWVYAPICVGGGLAAAVGVSVSGCVVIGSDGIGFTGSVASGQGGSGGFFGGVGEAYSTGNIEEQRGHTLYQDVGGKAGVGFDFSHTSDSNVHTEQLLVGGGVGGGFLIGESDTWVWHPIKW